MRVVYVLILLIWVVYILILLIRVFYILILLIWAVYVVILLNRVFYVVMLIAWLLHRRLLLGLWVRMELFLHLLIINTCGWGLLNRWRWNNGWMIRHNDRIFNNKFMLWTNANLFWLKLHSVFFYVFGSHAIYLFVLLRFGLISFSLFGLKFMSDLQMLLLQFIYFLVYLLHLFLCIYLFLFIALLWVCLFSCWMLLGYLFRILQGPIAFVSPVRTLHMTSSYTWFLSVFFSLMLMLVMIFDLIVLLVLRIFIISAILILLFLPIFTFFVLFLLTLLILSITL